MTLRRKRIYARITTVDDKFITDWNEIQFTSFVKELNGGLGECVLKVDVPFDYDGLDMREGNNVEIVVVDEQSTNDTAKDSGFGNIPIYKGYISLIERNVSTREDWPVVHLLGYYTLLGLDVLKNSTQTTLYTAATGGLTTASGSLAAADIGEVMRAVIDRYRSETTNPRIWYNDTADVPDFSEDITYIFQQNTYRQALDKLKNYAPSGVYWYVNEYGKFTFKSQPTTPTHTFVFGKDFQDARAFRDVEKVRNVILVWNGSDGSGLTAQVYKQYTDTASIAKYGRRVQQVTDTGIANVNVADQIGAKVLAESKDPQLKVICTINDLDSTGKKGYDLETIHPGDTCDFVGFSSTLADIFRGNMLITKVTYRLTDVTIEAELVRSGVVTTQKQQGERISEVATGALNVPETYTT